MLFYANGSKEKNGIVPIMGRVTINGTVAQFSCKRSIAKELWDAKGNRAKGKSLEARDTGASDHIERKTMPKNADPTRTHLNRELVQFPDGVADRTEAISHRIRTADIRRKITPDQVRAIRIVLSGTHEDMVRVQDEGRLSEWCDGNLQWLHRTFGRENTVSAVLHMDEHTPHIHATVVPIVTGERRKAKKKQADSKRTYRKKANAVRLCADDLLTRERLVAYHDSYAEAMAKYGLNRGTPPPPNTTVT